MLGYHGTYTINRICGKDVDNPVDRFRRMGRGSRSGQTACFLGAGGSSPGVRMGLAEGWFSRLLWYFDDGSAPRE